MGGNEAMRVSSTRHPNRRFGQRARRPVGRPRQRGPPCARHVVSRSADFTIPIPARTGS